MRKHHRHSGQEMVEVVRASYIVLCGCLFAIILCTVCAYMGRLCVYLT